MQGKEYFSDKGIGSHVIMGLL